MAVIKLYGIADNGASTTNPLLHAGDIGMDTETGQIKRADSEMLWLSIPANDNSPRVGTVASSATPTINTDLVDQFNITLLAIAITSFTTNLTGSPDDGDLLDVRITGDATPRAIAWGSKFTGLLLTTTAASKTHLQRLKYDTVAAKWAGYLAETTGY